MCYLSAFLAFEAKRPAGSQICCKTVFSCMYTRILFCNFCTTAMVDLKKNKFILFLTNVSVFWYKF